MSGFSFKGTFNLTVLIAGLGYLVDTYDLFLYNVVRVRSLTDMGLSGDALTTAGLFILNSQMAGLLLGALLWGALSDRIGRKPGLFASILVYSLGSLLCATVHDPHMYALGRFITGLGIAGEMGSGIALISETLPANKRGPAVMIFISMGFLGILLAALGSEWMPWREMYLYGGIAGFVILGLRTMLSESPLFRKADNAPSSRGRFRLIFFNPVRCRAYLASILLVTPAIFISQILWTLSPEIGKSMGLADPVKANIIIAIGYSCVIVGDILASALSETMKSRKKATIGFLVFGIVIFALYVVNPPSSMAQFYAFNGMIGLTFGMTVILSVWIAEQFGTNIRAIVTTTVPSFCRAAAIPMNIAFGHLKVMGVLTAVGIIGGVVFALALLGWFILKETYGKNLDFIETNDSSKPV